MSTKKTVKKAGSKKDAPVKEKTMTGNTGRKYVMSSKGVTFWSPKEGDVVEGEYLETMEFKGGKYSKVKNKKGDPIQLKPVIVTEEGEQIVLPDTASVTKFFADVVKGDFVMLKYNGLKTKAGQEGKKKPETYHSYDMGKEMK